MNHLDVTLEPDETLAAPRSTILLPVAMGMAVNLLTLALGNPYQMAVVGLVVALVATLVWSGRPFNWIIFAAVVAANPANYPTPIAFNLYCGAIFLVLMKPGGWKALPRPAQAALFFVLLSMVVSVIVSLPADLAIPSIHTTDVSRPRAWMVTWMGGASFEVFTSQLVSVINYLLGPFLFIPLIFSRIRQDQDPNLLLKGLVFALIMPTLLIFLLARTFGQPIMDAAALGSNMQNVSFRLGKIDIQMIRTQAGIILAALICASFAVSISRVRRGTRNAAIACLIVAAYFLLITGSVGSTLAALAGIMMILVMGRHRFSIKRYLTTLILGIGLVLTTWAVLPQGIRQYAVSRYELRLKDPGSSTSDRSWRWRKSFNYLMENPSGVGWSLWVEPLNIYPHNDYLSYAIAYGVLCGLVYILYPSGLLFSFFLLRPRPKDPSSYALALAGAGVTTVLIINSLSDHMTANRWYFNVVWSLIWYAYFASRARPDSSASTTA